MVTPGTMGGGNPILLLFLKVFDMHKKRRYTGIMMSIKSLDVNSSILSCSIMADLPFAEVTGQEIGKVYDFKEDPTTGEFAGKHFNHTWE